MTLARAAAVAAAAAAGINCGAAEMQFDTPVGDISADADALLSINCGAAEMQFDTRRA